MKISESTTIGELEIYFRMRGVRVSSVYLYDSTIYVSILGIEPFTASATGETFAEALAKAVALLDAKIGADIAKSPAKVPA